MTVFRIAHISDMHFGRYEDWLNPLEKETGASGRAKAIIRHLSRSRNLDDAAKIFYPSTFNPDAAAKLLHFLANEADELDAILVTGDLATTGHAFDLELAKNYFHGLVPSEWNPNEEGLPSLLSDGELAVVTLPGNHDRYAGVGNQPSSKNFEKHFGRFWDFERKKVYGVALPHAETGRVRVSSQVLDDAMLICFLVDFSLEDSHAGKGGAGFIGQGRVAGGALIELVKATIEARKEALSDGFEAAIVWAVHFPPEFPDVEEDLLLLDSEKLTNAASQCGVSILFAGHTHETLLYRFNHDNGIVICSGPTTGVSAHGLYSLSIIELEVSGRTIKAIAKHFAWDEYEFREQCSFPTQ